MEIVIWLIVGLLVGGVIGALATWWISRARGGAVSVMQMKQENEKFRNEVTEHFVETARLINQMTDSYKQVFDHLSSGAEKLVDNKRLAERLPPASGREVRLSQFGASVSADTAQGASAQAKREGASQTNREGGSQTNREGASQTNKSGGASQTKRDGSGQDRRGAGGSDRASGEVRAKPSESADPLKSKSGPAGSSTASAGLSGSSDRTDGSKGKSAPASNQGSGKSHARD